MMNLMKFILNERDLEGTIIEKYIDITASEKTPEVYKPRQGKINQNIGKYTKTDLDYMY